MKKILIIEDDPAIMIGMEQLFVDENYSVLTSNEGDAGLKLALQEIPDLIILDINLPNLNGIDICKTLRENNFNNAIIMVTARSEQIDKVIGLEIGADDYITKPFNKRELISRVRANLRRNEKLLGSVKEEDLNGTGKKFARRLLAIMFTDMKDYSRKMHEDEKLTLKLLSIHNEIIKNKIDVYKGRIIEIIGDAFLVSFNSAVKAAECAESIQQEFKKYNESKIQKEQIEIRIGLHLGDVMEFENHLKGDVLNIASRIQELTKTGSIYISESVYEVIKNKVSFHIKSVGERELKNIKEKIQLYEITI